MTNQHHVRCALLIALTIVAAQTVTAILPTLLGSSE